MRILFVDDEPHILEGLSNLLRKQRRQWDMVFGAGAEAALHELDKAPFDVVITDMRMPIMDGAELLAEVRERHPATARIVLSGDGERSVFVRSMTVAHQVLRKPCDAEQLRVVVSRACELHKLVGQSGIRAIVGKLDKLPSPPATYWELTRAAAREDVSLSELAGIVESDVAMSAKVMQLVNSPIFSNGRNVTSVQQAVGRLGVELLKALALTVHAFGTQDMVAVPGFSLEAHQKRSLKTAQLAKRIVGRADLASEAFTAALMQDVGKIVLASAAPNAYSQALSVASVSADPCHALEQDLCGASHAAVGGYLLGFWGLPMPIVEAVVHHHTPNQANTQSAELLLGVHVADAFMSALDVGADPFARGFLDAAFLARHCHEDQLHRWLELAERIYAGEEA